MVWAWEISRGALDVEAGLDLIHFAPCLRDLPLYPVSVPAPLAPVDPVKQARQIMIDALCDSPKHSESCEGQKFANHNRYLPPRHPAWKPAPACTCWIGQMATWLEATQV
jgi:hypothetical protein